VRDIGYAWIYQKDRITEGVLKEVRQKDVVSLLFPYEPVSVAVGEIGGSMRSTSTEFLLKLETILTMMLLWKSKVKILRTIQ